MWERAEAGTLPRNLKFWCVGGAAVVVPCLVRGIPAVQSGPGSGLGRVRPWCFSNQNLSAKLDKPAPVSRPPLAWHAPSHYQPNASREKELWFLATKRKASALLTTRRSRCASIFRGKLACHWPPRYGASCTYERPHTQITFHKITDGTA